MPKNGNPNTVVNGLYAIGECSCVSVHGANRLGTNSLLDLLVFGRAAAITLSKRRWPANPTSRCRPMLRTTRFPALPSSTHRTAASTRRTLPTTSRRAMPTHAGVFRTQKSMDEGVVKVLAIAERAANLSLKDKSQVFNTARIEALEVANLMEAAKATMVSAAARKGKPRRAYGG